MTVEQIDNWIKKFTFRSILFIFNCRSKICNQSWSHESVRMVSDFEVYTRIILLDHNFHYNTTLQLFNCRLLFVCYNNNSFQFGDLPPLILVTLNCFQIYSFKTQQPKLLFHFLTTCNILYYKNIRVIKSDKVFVS